LSSVPSTGDLYDWELSQLGTRGDDIAWFASLADDGRVLELGCGTGRVARPLADGGAEVVGLDLDLEMLRRGAGHPGVHLVCADMRAFAFATAFDVVALPYNGLQLLLEDADRLACLQAAEAHLAPDGVVAFEITDYVTGVVQASVPHEPIASGQVGDVAVELLGAVDVDLDRRVMVYRRRFRLQPGPVVERDVALYCFRPGEVEALLGRAGLHGRVDRPRGNVERWVASRITPCAT
jgi:SAM-dependent methyltransferase